MKPYLKAPAAWSTAIVCLIAICTHPSITSACAVCFGDPDDAQTKGMNMAIFVMIGVTYLVVLGLLAMFITLTVRAKRRTSIAQQGEHVAC
jgi:heme/copper-type cytochrome/quinol oxidase subunit 2